MRMNETINTMPEYERLRADYEKRLQEVEQNYQNQLIQMADEAKRANMAKTDFLRRMSHDMRTPINAINGYVRIAGAFPDDQVKQQECRNKILTASGYLLEMIKSVLDMSKLESDEVILAEHFQERIKGKLIFFSGASAEIEESLEKVTVRISAQKGKWRIQGEERATVMRPEILLRHKSKEETR